MKQLVAKDFNTREKAERELGAREDATAALRKAAHSSDADLAKRAARILRIITLREDHRALDSLAALVKNGEIDLFVEKAVRRKRWEDLEAFWSITTTLAGKLVDLEKDKYRKTRIGEIPPPGSPGAPVLPESLHELPFWDFPRYHKLISPLHIDTRDEIIQRGGHFLIRGDKCAINELGFSLVVLTGDLRAPSIAKSGIFTNGSVEVDLIGAAVVVCDGHFTANKRIAGSLIIAREGVTCRGWIGASVVVTPGSIKVRHPVDENSSVVKEKQTPPLGFVKFFEPSRVGVEVVTAEKGARVTAAPADKPFGVAGLRAGDVVTGIDAMVVDSHESFRRALRRKIAEGGKFTLKVRRTDKSVEIPVHFKE